MRERRACVCWGHERGMERSIRGGGAVGDPRRGKGCDTWRVRESEAFQVRVGCG